MRPRNDGTFGHEMCQTLTMGARPTLFSAYIALSLFAHSGVSVMFLGARMRQPVQPGSAVALVGAEGATFDISTVEEEDATFDEVSPASAAAEAATPRPDSGRPAAPRPSQASRGQGGSGRAASAQYGAVGVRSAVDLTRALVRALPQVASVDSAWSRTAFGSAGSARITLTLSEEGHIVGESIQGGSPELRRALERSLALLRSRAFTARSKTTVLNVQAKVSKDDIHDGLHGDVYALGASEGHGFFALAIGRRIDINLE